MKRRHASQWVSGPCYFLVIHQRLEWLQCDSCVITWEAPNKWVDDMFEQLQTVTLSLCHFNVYHSMIVHVSLNSFVLWPAFLQTGDVLQDFVPWEVPV